MSGPPGSRTCTRNAERTEASAGSTPTSRSAASWRLSDSSVPLSSIAYTSPVSPGRAPPRIPRRSFSIVTAKPSTATTLPAPSRAGVSIQATGRSSTRGRAATSALLRANGITTWVEPRSTASSCGPATRGCAMRPHWSGKRGRGDAPVAQHDVDRHQLARGEPRHRLPPPRDLGVGAAILGQPRGVERGDARELGRGLRERTLARPALRVVAPLVEEAGERERLRVEQGRQRLRAQFLERALDGAVEPERRDRGREAHAEDHEAAPEPAVDDTGGRAPRFGGGGGDRRGRGRLRGYRHRRHRTRPGVRSAGPRVRRPTA